MPGNHDRPLNSTTTNDDVSSVSSVEVPTDDGKKFPISGLVVIGLILACLYSMGMFHVLVSARGDNNCQMTYMFEFPQYVPIEVESSSPHSKYKLFVYGEGKMTEKLRDFKFDGIPVLFIPGNSGSYKQVRSLASVALRKSLDDSKHRRRHFDFFAVDFEEELSAVYGEVLQDQAVFAALCIQRVLRLYEGNKSRPKSVVLIGHSIGGVVAKAVFLQPKFNRQSVTTIITLATPHTPVILFDQPTAEFYRKVNQFWDHTDLGHVVMVSVAGGDKDIQVRSGLARSHHADVNVVSTAIPGAWVSADHLCIVWCKQIVLSIVRSLFDCVDANVGQMTEDASHRRQVFSYHLLQRSAGKSFKPQQVLHPASVKLDKDGYWSDVLKRQFVFERGNVTCNTYLMIKVVQDSKYRWLMLDAVNMDNDNWVFGCKATSVHKGTRVCEKGDNLSHRSFILPSNGKRKSVRLDLEKIGKESGYTHVVVFVPKHVDNVKVIVDVFDPVERQLKVELPRWFTFWRRPYLVAETTAPDSLYYYMPLKGLDETWQAYTVVVEPTCKQDKMKEHYGLIRFVTPWDASTTQSLIGFNASNSLTVKLPVPKLPEYAEDHPNPHLEFYLNPSCDNRITIGTSILEMWGQMARFYFPMLIPYLVSVIIASLSVQTRFVAKEKKTYNFVRVLTSRLSPVAFVMPSKVVSFALGFVGQHYITDYHMLQFQGIDFGMLSVVLFFTAFGIVLVVGSAAWFCILVFGNLANQSFVRYVLRTVSTSNELTAKAAAITGISKFPIVLSAVLVAVASASCGSLALCIGTFCQLVHLFFMYKDQLEKLVKNALDLTERKETVDLTAINLQFTNALLWVSMSILNAPALITWTKTSQVSLKLAHDPSLVPALTMAACLPFLWGENYPNVRLKHYGKLAMLQHIFSILILVCGCVSIYKVNYFICPLFVVSVAHQLLSTEESEPPNPPPERMEQSTRPTVPNSGDEQAFSISGPDGGGK